MLMVSIVLLLDGSSGDVRVPLWVKRGILRFPEDRHTPVVMVGPGTGVAPFRSAVQERVSQGRHGKSLHCLAWPGPDRLGPAPPTLLSLFRCRSANVLFFGCRSEYKDFYFQSEWEEKEAAGQLSLFTAFSRDQVG